MTVTEVPTAGIDVDRTLRSVPTLRGDPTTRRRPGHLERATITPDGVGVIEVAWSPRTDRAVVTTRGDGARWLADRAPALLGRGDDPSGFEPPGAPLRELWRRHPGLRLAKTGTLWHDLALFVLQQRVATVDAADQWRRLVRDLGVRPPGERGLVAPPPPDVVAALTYHQLHRYGIERQRADNLIRSARAAVRLDGRVDDPWVVVEPILRSVPGIGPWTASNVAAHTWGEPDTAIVGDLGIPSLVSWVLAGERKADDQRMLELLEPFRPHRYRVLRLAMMAGTRPPRRHPRARRIDIRRY